MTEKCPFCDKVGLPILPVRYAVANASIKSQKAPLLQSPFGDEVKDIVLPAGQADYTMRLLGAGYLYVFNEKRGEWSGYVVTERGYLYWFDVKAKTPPPGAKDIEFNCSRIGDSEIARCISVKDPEKAGNLWLAFTRTAWTKPLLAEHAKESFRKRNMRKINVGDWVKGKTNQPHTSDISKITELVSDYVFKRPELEPSAVSSNLFTLPILQKPVIGPVQLETIMVTNYPAIDHSTQSFIGLAQDAKALIDWATITAKNFKPILVSITDPVGIADDLARLMSRRLKGFMSKRELQRPMMVSSAISSLEQQIRNNAEFQSITSGATKAVIQANQTMDPGYMGSGDGGGAARAGMALAEYFNPNLAESRRQMRESLTRELLQSYKPTPEKLNEVADKEWAKYSKKIRTSDLQKSRDTFKNDAKKFDETIIVPLAKAHKAWMKSKLLADHFDCNHDEKDPHSGQAYVDTLLLCIQDSQQIKISFDLYADWLNQPEIKRDNLILRALTYNQENIAKNVNKALGDIGFKPDALNGMGWDELINGYEKSLELLAKGGENAVARLTVALGGPITSVMGKAVDKLGAGLICMGLVGRAPIVMVDGVFTKAEAIRELITRMAAINPKVAELKTLQSAIDLEMRRSEIRGTPLYKQGKFRYYIIADERVVKDFPSTATATAKKFAQAGILTEADYQQLTKARWKTLMPTNIRLGIVTSIFQTVALLKFADDLDKSMLHERKENTGRWASGMTALIGTAGEIAGNWLEAATVAGNKMAVWLESKIGIVLRVGGKILGFIAAGIMAIWDIARAVQEYKEGNYGIATLFIVSAVAGGGAALLLTGWFGATIIGLSSTGVGIVLAVIAVVIAVLIEVFKDNKLQDWLERCHFGSFAPNDRYKDADTEMKELKLSAG
jgi:hypothetical protein